MSKWKQDEEEKPDDLKDSDQDGRIDYGGNKMLKDHGGSVQRD